MAVYTYRNTHPKPYVDLAVALAGGTPGTGGVAYVNTNPKAYIDAEFTAAGGTPPGSGYVNANPLAYINAGILTLDVPDPADTTAPNTTIDSGPSGTVSDNTPTFTFSSSEPGSTFETKMDAGAWTPSTSPKTYGELADGSHTFQVRATDAAGNTDASPASTTWTIATTTFPPTGLTLQWAPSDTSDWTTLIESAPGSSITDVTKDGAPAIRIYEAGPNSNSGDRVELHSLDLSEGGVDASSEAYYEWEFNISAATDVNNTNPDSQYANTINQFHGNENAGYTGGWRITTDSNLITVAVEGGLRVSSNNYEFEDYLTVGEITRDTWHKAGYHVQWNMDYQSESPTGFARAYLDDVLCDQFENVPTMGDKRVSGRIAGTGPTTAVMFRLGWYVQSVGAAGAEMWVRNVKVYT